MPLVNMAMSAEEAKEQYGSVAPADPSDLPKYPYGLEISLDDEALAKLGLTSPPAVGTVVTITARAKVCSTSAYETEGDAPEQTVRMQITDMEIGAAAGSSPDPATVLYG